MEKLKTFFDFVKKGDKVVEVKRKDDKMVILDMLGGISRMHFNRIQVSDDPLQYVKDHLPHCINSNRYDLLQIYIYIEEYNKVYKYYNLNEQVFNWDFDRVCVLSKQPPNLITNICDDDYPDIYAVFSFFKNVDKSAITKNYSLDTIYHVRKYVVCEDFNVFDTVMDMNEVYKLLEELRIRGFVKKIPNTDYYIVVKQNDFYRPHKRSRVMEKFDIFNVLKNIFPSFNALNQRIKMLDTLKNMQSDFGIVPLQLELNNDVNDVLDPKVIFIVFRKTSDYNFKTYRYGSDILDDKLRVLSPHSKICFVFNSKYVYLKMMKDKHPFFNDISKMTAVYHHIRLLNENIKTFKMSKLLIYNA